MWKCPKCNKENNGNYCVLCGEVRPGVNGMQHNHNTQYNNMQQTNYARNNAYGKENRRKKTNVALIVTCIILAVLLLVTVVLFSILAFTDTRFSFSRGLVQRHDDVIVTDEPYDDGDSEEDESDGGDEAEVVLELDPSDSGSYLTYSDYYFDFVCPYPANFREVSLKGVNAVKSFESPDRTAEMTIRACVNSNDIDIETAMNDFYNAMDGEVTYDAKGDTWYASSIDLGDRLLYRKCFIENGNIYCFDFEFNEFDVDYYGPYIEYIEDNFEVL